MIAVIEYISRKKIVDILEFLAAIENWLRFE